MLITNHVLIGAAIGALSPSSGSAFTAGVASHFLADSLPHWGGVDQSTFLKVAVTDGLVGLAVMGAITKLTPPSKRSKVLSGMLGSCLPDANKPAKLFFGRSPFPALVDSFHARVQDEHPSRLPREGLTALLLSIPIAVALSASR